MKKLFMITAVIMMAASVKLNAQIRIDWQQCYGNTVDDYAYNIHETDNGLAVFGLVYEDPYVGMYDCHYIDYGANWLFEINDEHSIINQNCYQKGLYPKLCKGATNKQYVAQIARYVWNLSVMRIDEAGEPIWERTLGTDNVLASSASDVLSIVSPDGGVIAGVLCGEASGDVTLHYGGLDCWLVKLDSLGNMAWETTLGTQGNENLTCLKNASDGGFYVGLKSPQSGNGNIGCGQPENSSILVKMDTSGQMEWDLCFPQINISDVIELEDGFLLAGHVSFDVGPYENCGDGIHTSDCCLLRCDSEGNILWEKNYGGSCIDKVVKAFRNEADGYTVFANSKSLDGDVASAANLGVTDDEKGNIWVFHVDSDGDLIWERCIGSALGLLENVRDVIEVGENEYVLLGESEWFEGVSSGDVNCSNNTILPNSGSNIWVMQLTDVFYHDFLEDGSEWYYEIENENGTITYQHLECVGDTLMTGGKRPKIIIRSNTQYDKDLHTEVTHEYIYEENGKVYWWNKQLQQFTTLYNYAAEIGDEWEILVGTEKLTMHVDTVENIEHEGSPYTMLRVSDGDGLFSGDIICGIGHLTSFFPERLMNRGKNYRVEGMRCYWVDGELVFKHGDEDCDEIYQQLHNGIEENGASTGSGTFMVYPNPANDILVVETFPETSLRTYRITNLMGQVLLQGNLNAENQQIDIKSLPAGMYFITIGEMTQKFVVK